MAITTVNGAYADPNTNLGKQLVKEERGKDYLTKEYSDYTGQTTFGLPEWIPNDSGKYVPYQIFENTETYVIENKYLPLSIDKNDCTTSLYLSDERILDGADTLIEKMYWTVSSKGAEADPYLLIDTSAWDCDVQFSSGKNFSAFTTFTKSHGFLPLTESQYDITTTNSTGTFYFTTTTETTNNPTVSQQTITNSTGTFTVDVWEDNFTTITTNTPVIQEENISTFEVEYRYLIEEGDVESFTRITNNDPQYENHYFQFKNIFEGVNYDAFNLGDDIEFTDDSYIGTYYATADQVPEKYIAVAEQGYPLYYSLEKGEEWWSGAGATIYMDGVQKKLNVTIDFGKDRSPLPLDTMQELDPTWTSGSGTVWRADTANSTGSSCPTSSTYWASNTQSVRIPEQSSADACTRSGIEFDTSGLDNSYIVTDADLTFSTSTAQSTYNCSFTAVATDDLSTISTSNAWGELDGDGTIYLDNDSSCKTTGSHTVDLGTTADSHIQNSNIFSVGVKATDESRPAGSSNIIIGSLTSTTLTVTYELPTVSSAPTALSTSDVSTSQIDLSWSTPSDSGVGTVPAVSGYRIQTSDFAYANMSIPTGRTADSDAYGSLTGDVDMVNANLYLSMNTTQNIPNSITNEFDFSSNTGWSESDSSRNTVNTSLERIDFDLRRDTTVDSMAYDLGSGDELSDTAWVIRFKMHTDGVTNADGSALRAWIGMSSGDHTQHHATSQDTIGFMIKHGSGSSERDWLSGWANNADTESNLTELGTNLNDARNGSDSYIEIKRTGSTTAQISVSSTDAYDGDIASNSITGMSGVSGLRYFVILNTDTSYSTTSNQTDGWIDDLKIYDGVTSVNAFEDVILDESYRGNHATLASTTITQSSYDVVTTLESSDKFFGGTGIVNSNSALYGKTLSSVSFWLSKSGTVSGNLEVELRDSSFNLRHQFGTLDATTLTSSATKYTFDTAMSGITINAGDVVGVNYDNTSGANSVDIHYNNGDNYDSTDTIFNRWTGSAWTNQNTVDNAFEFITATVDISKDTDLNFEGTNSAVFDGSTNYMTLPSDNTIISTTGAFTLGTWVKPDRIVEITVNEGYSSGFTTVGSTVIIDSNHVKSQNSGTISDHRQHKALGTTLSNDKWLVRFEFDYSSSTSASLPLALTSSTGNMHTANHDALGLYMDAGILNTWYKDGSGSLTAGSTQTLDGTTSSTQYYVELARTSSTTFTMKVFTDSSFTTQHGTTKTQTIPSTVQGLTTLQHGTWTGAGGSSGQTWEIANTKIYDGISSLDDQTIFSYPSSAGSVDFNIEDTNLAFRSGDKNNDPIITRTHGMNEGSWNNVAVSRDGSNNFEIFVNGTRVGAVASNSTAINAKTSGENYYIGKTLLPTVPLNDDFSSDNWTHDTDNPNGAGTMYAKVESGKLKFKFARDTDSTGSIYNLGSALPNTWQLKFTYTVTTAGTGYADKYRIGLSDQNSIEYSTTTDHLLWQVDNHENKTGLSFEDNSDMGSGTVSSAHGGYSTGTTYYATLERVDIDTSKITIRNTSHSGSVFDSYEYDLPSGTVDGLQYVIIANDNGATDNAQTMELFELDDMTIEYDDSINYLDGKLDEMYVLSTQSDTVIDNISSRGENTWTDLSYNTGTTGTTYSHTGITGGGGTYKAYRVSAHNSAGLSTFDLGEGTTSNTPSAPQNFAITETSPTVLDLTWTAPASEGASAVTGYKIERGTDGVSYSVIVADTGNTNLSYQNTGLTSDTRYYYRISAINSIGAGATALADAYTLLNAPTGLSATGVSVSQIDLSWTAPTGANNLDGYKIEYNNGSWLTLVADTGNTNTSYSHTGLSTGDSFTYRISGLNGVLAGLSSVTAQGSTYAVPSAITDLSASGITASSIRLSWTAPSATPALTGYKIEQSEDNSTWSNVVADTGNTNLTYDVTSLSEGTTYYFRVSGINSLGTGSASNIASSQTGASQSGGGGSGGGSASFIPQFDELVSLSVFGNAHKLTLGESVQDTLRLEWNSAEDLQVNEIIVGDNPFRFAVQKPPFIVLGDSDGLSNAEISYTIQVPNNYCTMDITVQCVEPEFYELPVNVKVLSEGRTITKNVVITVDLSSGFDPALFVILLVAGIASLGIYRISRGSGKKRNGSVRKSISSKPSGRKNGSVKKALSL